jgi:hypothetical protein
VLGDLEARAAVVREIEANGGYRQTVPAPAAPVAAAPVVAPVEPVAAAPISVPTDAARVAVPKARPAAAAAQLDLGLGTGNLEAVLDVLRSHPGREYARAEILATVDGLDESAWLTVSKQLAVHPDVAKTGERRGTRYRWSG